MPLQVYSLQHLPKHKNLPAYLSTDGLLSWWPFNGNAHDENGNNGTLNGATLTKDRFGVINSAYAIEGGAENKIVNQDTPQFSFDSSFSYPKFLLIQTIKNKVP